MTGKAAITIFRSREEVERLWRSPAYERKQLDGQASVRFAQAPGGRGTEIHVEVEDRGGRLGGVLGSAELAEVKNELRRFKQHVETGEVPRSDGSPEGERVGRKLKQRPAQPLERVEAGKAGV